MSEALLWAVVVAAGVYAGLSALVWLWHKLVKRPRHWAYTWGIGTFALLAGIYTFVTSLGRI